MNKDTFRQTSECSGEEAEEGLLGVVMAKQSEIIEAHTARKKLRWVELGRKVKARCRHSKKRRECVDSQFFVPSTKKIVPLSGHSLEC